MQTLYINYQHHEPKKRKNPKEFEFEKEYVKFLEDKILNNHERDNNTTSDCTNGINDISNGAKDIGQASIQRKPIHTIFKKSYTKNDKTMNVKEAITEIEKRYKVGDKIPCLASGIDHIKYSGIDSIIEIETTNEYVWVQADVGIKCKIYKPLRWSEPIREEKNLWNFFNSIEGTYPDVVEKYLRNLDFSFTIREGGDKLIIGAFDWEKTKEGFEYWENISELYWNYLEN